MWFSRFIDGWTYMQEEESCIQPSISRIDVNVDRV
jgi:hypothetical protein